MTSEHCSLTENTQPMGDFLSFHVILQEAWLVQRHVLVDAESLLAALPANPLSRVFAARMAVVTVCQLISGLYIDNPSPVCRGQKERRLSIFFGHLLWASSLALWAEMTKTLDPLLIWRDGPSPEILKITSGTGPGKLALSVNETPLLEHHLSHAFISLCCSWNTFFKAVHLFKY